MTSPQDERERIASAYSQMSDEELEQVAQSWDELTDIAKEALRAAAARRGRALSLDSHGFGTYELDHAVTVAKFRDLPEALLAKGSLESAGMACYLIDDNMIRMDWFYSNLSAALS